MKPINMNVFIVVAVSFCCCIVQLVYCVPVQSSCDHLGPTQFSYKHVQTSEDILKLGCNIKCRLTETGVYKDGVINNNIVDADFKELAIVNECNSKLPTDKDEQDCTHFFEVWKCLEKLREPWSHLDNINEIEEKCGGDNECYGKCVYEELNILKDGVFTSENTPENLAPEYRKYIVKSLDLCHEKINENYEEGGKYECEYFEDFNKCFKKQLSIF